MYDAFQKIAMQDAMQDFTNAYEAIYGAATQAIAMFFADYKIELYGRFINARHNKHIEEFINFGH